MQYLEFILLGILQGITEFLPISSSGHLLIGRRIFGINDYGILIEVFLHLGTLFSIILYWYKDIIKEFKLVINGERQFLYSIIIATIPASIVGFLFNDFIQCYSREKFHSRKHFHSRKIFHSRFKDFLV